MCNEHSTSLGWRRRLALACIVAMGLGTIVGCGGDGGDPPPPSPPEFFVGPNGGEAKIGPLGGTIKNQ